MLDSFEIIFMKIYILSLPISGRKRKYDEGNSNKKDDLKKSKNVNKSSTNNSLNWLQCQHCENKFLTENGLKIHIGKIHPSRKEPADGEFLNMVRNIKNVQFWEIRTICLIENTIIYLGVIVQLLLLIYICLLYTSPSPRD